MQLGLFAPDAVAVAGMTQDQFNVLLTELSNAPLVVVDIEGTGIDLWGGDVVIGIAFYIPHVDRSYYVPIAHGAHGPAPKLSNKACALWDTHFGAFYVQANIPDAIERLHAVWPTVQAWQMYNAQFDMLALELAGLPEITVPVYDVMLAAHVYNTDWKNARVTMPDGTEVWGNKSLKWQAAYHDVHVTVRGETVSARDGESRLIADAQHVEATLQKHGSGRVRIDSKRTLWALHPDATAFYAEMDVRLTYRLWQAYEPLLRRYDVTTTYYWLCDLQQHVAMRMQRTGFRFDREAAQNMQEYAHARLATLRRDIEHHTHVGFNPSSAQQVTAFLQQLGVDAPSADKTTLKGAQDLHDAIPLILQYRKLLKSANTYTDAWLDAALDNVIHPGFNATGTTTGRWSSSSVRYGNLQNIPRDSVGDNSPKSLLAPHRDDFVLIEVDYDTLEIRIMAWIAERLLHLDPQLTLTKIGVGDMHTYTMERIGMAELVLGTPVTEAAVRQYYTTRDMPLPSGDIVATWRKKVVRSMTKVVNFAAAYGGGANALLDVLTDLDHKTAQAIMDGWRSTYPSIPAGTKYFQDLAQTLRATPDGVGAGLYIRYPHIEGVGQFIRNYSHYPTARKGARGAVYNPLDKEAYKAFNSIVQGTAGLITLESARRVNEAYPDSDILHMHATVHDSLILAVQRDNLHIVKHIMAMMADYPTTPALSVGLDAAPVGMAWGYKRAVQDIDMWIASKGEVWGA